MLSFVPYIDIKTDGRVFRFHIKEVGENVFAIKYQLHQIENADHVAFGYIVYRCGFIYAYAIEKEHETDERNYRLVFTTCIGSETNFNKDELFRNDVFTMIGTAFVQYSLNIDVHPSIVDKRRLECMRDALVQALKGDVPPENLTPYVFTLAEIASILAGFYTRMKDELEDISAELLPTDKENNT